MLKVHYSVFCLALVVAKSFAGITVMHDPSEPLPSPEETPLMHYVDEEESKPLPRSGPYIRIGAGDPRVRVSGLQNSSAKPSSGDLPVSKPEFHRRKTSLNASIGYKTPEWAAEFEFVKSKTFRFDYEPFLTTDNLAPTMGLDQMRADFGLRQTSGYFNYIAFFPLLPYQPEQLQFFSLAGVGLTYLSGNVLTTGINNVDATLIGSSNESIVANQPRSSATAYTTRVAWQLGVGAKLTVIERVFFDASFRFSENGALTFGPVEGSTLAPMPVEGVKIFAKEVKNYGLHIGAGVHFR